MASFITKIEKFADGEAIGAKVTIEETTTGDVEVQILKAKDFNDLKQKVDSFVTERNITQDNIVKSINDLTAGGAAINVLRLNGKSGSDYAEANHTHAQYSPTNHRSAETTYGLGSATEYGHVRVFNQLDSIPNDSAGVALGAKAGTAINTKFNNVESSISTVNSGVNRVEGDLTNYKTEVKTWETVVAKDGKSGHLEIDINKILGLAYFSYQLNGDMDLTDGTTHTLEDPGFVPSGCRPRKNLTGTTYRPATVLAIDTSGAVFIRTFRTGVISSGAAYLHVLAPYTRG